MNAKELIISIKVKPKSKKEFIKKIQDNHFEVAVHSPPEDGKANTRLVELMSDYFNVPKKNISIIKGEKSRNKVIKIVL